MANPVWPNTLPQSPKISGLSETPPGQILRTDQDVGPAMTRPRSTADVRVFAIELAVSRTQLDTFDSFFVTTLRGGALAFDWKNPRTGNVATFRIVGKPTYSSFKPNSAPSVPRRIGFTMEQLPGTEVFPGDLVPGPIDPLIEIFDPVVSDFRAMIDDSGDAVSGSADAMIPVEADTPPPDLFVDLYAGPGDWYEDPFDATLSSTPQFDAIPIGPTGGGCTRYNLSAQSGAASIVVNPAGGPVGGYDGPSAGGGGFECDDPSR